MVYAPVYIYWMWLALRSRSFFFFSTSNPTIRNAGFLLESKKEIYDLIPDQYYPATLFFKRGEKMAVVLNNIRAHGMKFPLVGKPDIGMQGLAVKKLANANDLVHYVTASKVNFLLQEYIPYENEVGIFYYRFPNEQNGHISGIVRKEFLSVTGDGISTIETLLKKEKRFILQLNTLHVSNGPELKLVLNAGEKRVLVPYGNHVRGAKFLDISHLANEALVKVIDDACKKINGFYFGRMDVRYNDWEELCLGKNFSIIELNGAGSEPTHIYDPKNSIFFAWKEIIRHLNILARISRINHKQQCLSYMKLSDGLQMIRDNSRYVKLLNEVKRAI